MTPDRPRIRHIPEGSFAAVVRAYQRSEKFAKLRPGTQKSYLRVLALAERENGLGGLSVRGDIRLALSWNDLKSRR
jgi:hypothetical protein